MQDDNGSPSKPTPSSGRRHTKTHTISFRLTAHQVQLLESIDPAMGGTVNDKARFLLIQRLLEIGNTRD